MLTPMERNVKTYLVNAMSKDLIELLAKLAVERPDDPHFWLGVRLLERSPNGPYIAHKRSDLAKAKKVVREEGAGFAFGLAGGGGGGGGGGAPDAESEPPPPPAADEYGTSPATVSASGAHLEAFPAAS